VPPVDTVAKRNRAKEKRGRAGMNVVQAGYV